MTYKKIISIALCIVICIGVCSSISFAADEEAAPPADASQQNSGGEDTSSASEGISDSTETPLSDDNYNSNPSETSPSAHDVITVYAGGGKADEISGEGTTNTNIEVQQKTHDQFINEKIDEMAEQFGEDYSDYKIDINVDEISYENISGIDLSEITDTNLSLPNYYATQKPNSDVHAIDAGNGAIITAQDMLISDAQLAAFANTYKEYQNKVYNFNLNDIDAELFLGVDGKTYDVNSGSLASSAYMQTYIVEMVKWLHDNSGVAEMSSPMAYQITHPTLTSLIDYLNGNVAAKELGNSGIYVGVPIHNDVLHDSLFSYISALHDIGVNHVKVTKYTVYNAESFSVRTIRQSSPVYPLQHHWQVSNLSNTKAVDDWTENQPYIKIFFSSPGNYNITVSQKKNVIRNNKVSGYKTEIWVLNNGDAFDGLVFYNHTSTFNSFVSEDIGPTVEELQLTEDCFIANVTERMVGKAQMLDEHGYLHSSGEDFTTERN